MTNCWTACDKNKVLARDLRKPVGKFREEAPRRLAAAAAEGDVDKDAAGCSFELDHNFELWLAADLLRRIEWGEEGRDELTTLVNGKSNIFLVTCRDNRMLAVVSWHLHNAVFVGNSSSLPAEMGAPPGWFDNFGTVRWGGAGPQSRKQVLEYLLEGFGNMHDELLASQHLTAMVPLVDDLVIFATALVAGITVPEPTGPFEPIPRVYCGSEKIKMMHLLLNVPLGTCCRFPPPLDSVASRLENQSFMKALLDLRSEPLSMSTPEIVTFISDSVASRLENQSFMKALRSKPRTELQSGHSCSSPEEVPREEGRR